MRDFIVNKKIKKVLSTKMADYALDSTTLLFIVIIIIAIICICIFCFRRGGKGHGKGHHKGHGKHEKKMCPCGCGGEEGHCQMYQYHHGSHGEEGGCDDCDSPSPPTGARTSVKGLRPRKPKTVPKPAFKVKELGNRKGSFSRNKASQIPMKHTRKMRDPKHLITKANIQNLEPTATQASRPSVQTVPKKTMFSFD